MKKFKDKKSSKRSTYKDSIYFNKSQLKLIRQTEAYKRWKKRVKKRDNYTCQYEGCIVTKYLQVHHKKPLSECGPTERFLVSNGITYCPLHHKLVEKERNENN